MKDTILNGEKIILRTLRKEDLRYHKWFNDPEITKYTSHGGTKHTYEDNLEYFEELQKSKNAVVFAIVEKKTNKHIGNVSLQKIDWANKNAEIAIVIGEKDCWGKGYSSEAWKLLIEYGFNTLGLHRIWCGTHPDNIAMQKVAKKVGMQEEGRFKEAMYKDGNYCDIIRFGIINKGD